MPGHLWSDQPGEAHGYLQNKGTKNKDALLCGFMSDTYRRHGLYTSMHSAEDENCKFGCVPAGPDAPLSPTCLGCLHIVQYCKVDCVFHFEYSLPPVYTLRWR